MEPGSVVIVGSTVLKVYGKDEWHQEKHNVPARRTWRKTHLAIDESHQVLACDLTTPEVDDPTAILEKQPDALVVISPHKTAVCSDTCDTRRDRQIQTIAQQGDIAWRRITGTTCATMSSLPCNAISVFSATP